MNLKESDWPKKFAKILKEKSVSRRHFETNITSVPLGCLEKKWLQEQMLSKMWSEIIYYYIKPSIFRFTLKLLFLLFL